jgi:hypothetical protein
MPTPLIAEIRGDEIFLGRARYPSLNLFARDVTCFGMSPAQELIVNKDGREAMRTTLGAELSSPMTRWRRA